MTLCDTPSVPMYDRQCEAGHVFETYEPIRTTACPCPTCGAASERVWVQGNSSSVIPDDIPGGLMVEHGLCNADGSARRYDSRSEMAREAKRRGLVNHVVHIGEKGSDKSPNTSRWV